MKRIRYVMHNCMVYSNNIRVKINLLKPSG